MTSSPDTVRRRRKFPSRIDTRAASSLFRAAVSTSVVPLFRDRPPFARVFLPRAATSDSTVSLPQGLTVLPGLSQEACPVFHHGRTRP
ncbi:hypothetical protein SLUN_29105 [Streptomyces lunaelactis]|uniref:Uncharacterized protein n=1 Tax=Streptomyces lunaelactis TaxID=1535768 RepID=A0A2R4TF00_9ACTN|nr:hypothetical protein SLUN_29105 [Streptomyces lunaelactis]